VTTSRQLFLDKPFRPAQGQNLKRDGRASKYERPDWTCSCVALHGIRSIITAFSAVVLSCRDARAGGERSQASPNAWILSFAGRIYPTCRSFLGVVGLKTAANSRTDSKFDSPFNPIRVLSAFAPVFVFHFAARRHPPSPQPSPPGEGKSFAAPLKIYATGLAGCSSAKSATVESDFLSWGRGLKVRADVNTYSN